jgi:hypothetical protein
MKRFSISIAVLMLAQLACQFVAGTLVPTATPMPTFTPLPTLTPLPTSTPLFTATPPSTPEELNMGIHNYFRETVEAGCEASDDSKGTEYTEKEHIFSTDFSTVDYGGRTYQRTDLHRYESENQSDKPLVLIYSEIGYDLEVYNPGEDTKTTPACLIFRFKLAE